MPQGREWPKAGYLLLHTRLSYAFERASLIFISILSSRLNEQPLNEKQNIHVKWTRFTTLLSRYILLNFFFPSGSFRHNFQLLGELAWWTRWLEIHCSSWYKERWRTSASVSLRCKFFFFFFFFFNFSFANSLLFMCFASLCILVFAVQLYHSDNKKGKTYLAFSSDSSCTQNLENSTSGYETLVLTKSNNQKKMPDYVKTHLAS